MRCYLRRQIYVVNLLILALILPVFGKDLNVSDIERISKREVRKVYGDRVKVLKVSVYIRKPIPFIEIERVELSVRERNPRGNVHIYLRTKRGVRRVTATLDLSWKCELFVAEENIERGERVFPWKVSLKELFMERCPEQGIKEKESLINYVALKEIKRGEILKKSFLKLEYLVRRGEEVDIVYRRGNIEIVFRGKALQSGFYGDRIRVRSLNTGKILKGKVVSEGGVLIE